MSLETIMAAITDEGERTALAQIAEKYPSIRQFVDIGEAAAPVFSRLQGMQVDATAELSRLPEWVDYRTRNYDPQRGMYRSEAEAQDRVTALESEIEELRLKGAEMTPEEFSTMMDSKLAEKGFITKSGLKDEITQPGGVVNGAFSVMSKNFESIYSSLTPLAVEHAQKFGEAMPVQKVFDHMAATGQKDPVKAYGDLMAPKLREIEKQSNEAAIAKAKLEGVEEGKRLARSENTMPVGGGGGASAGAKANSFMSKIFGDRSKRNGSSGGGRLGSGEASRAGFDAWRAKRDSAASST